MQNPFLYCYIVGDEKVCLMETPEGWVKVSRELWNLEPKSLWVDFLNRKSLN